MLLLAHCTSLQSSLEWNHWETPRDAQQVINPYCTDTAMLWSQGKDPLRLGGFLPCLPQSAQDAMPEGLQGLGEPLMLLVLNANSATASLLKKKIPRYHGYGVKEAQRLQSKWNWVGGRWRECPTPRPWLRNTATRRQPTGLRREAWWDVLMGMKLMAKLLLRYPS